MKQEPELSVGLLVYRLRNGPEILLAHPGGPFWSKKDEGSVEQKSGKVLHGFAVEADLDVKNFRSPEFSLEWPPRSGWWQTFREIDRIEYFGLRTALRKILPYQWPMLLELSEKLGWRIPRAHATDSA